MKYFLITLLLLPFAEVSARADDDSSGCGLGWAVTNRYSLGSSIIRSTTNGLASNTLGMTFGTSGCDKHSIVKNEKRGLHFAEANYQNLVLEMAEGHGEHLEAFAAVLGCSASSFKSFSDTTRAHYLDIFPDPATGAGRMLNNVQGLLRAYPQLSSACKASA